MSLLLGQAVSLIPQHRQTKPDPARKTEAQEPKTNQEEPAESSADAPTERPADDLGGLEINDKTVGTGTEAPNGDLVTVHYTGRLSDGTKFDSSLDRDQPFEFLLGAGRVIEGWEKGVLGMKVGGRRELVIPPEMGYGEQGAGDAIPPNAVRDYFALFNLGLFRESAKLERNEDAY